MKSITEVALHSPVFRDLPKDSVMSLISKGSMKHATRGASLYLQGEAAHSLYIVLEGWVKLYRMSPCGSEAVVAVLTQEDCFGEASAIAEQEFPTGAEAVTDVHLLQFDGHDIRLAIEKDVAMCRSLLGATIGGNRALVHQLEQLKSHTGAQRIADFLLGLCNKEQGSCTVVLPYDKVLIAGWLGLKPESLSRAFKRLQPYGVTIMKNRATIKSVERLMQFADEDPSQSWKEKKHVAAKRAS